MSPEYRLPLGKGKDPLVNTGEGWGCHLLDQSAARGGATVPLGQSAARSTAIPKRPLASLPPCLRALLLLAEHHLTSRHSQKNHEDK